MAVSATVSPGKIFSTDETITISELNKLGTPTVDISGAVGSLSLSDGSVTNAKIAAAAAIQLDKLASGTSAQVVVANSSGVPTYVALSGDATISNAGALTLAADSVDSDQYVDGSIDAAHMSDNAITPAKMEDGTQGDVLIYGASGAPERLGFGTSGQFLKTQGTGANAVWADAPEGTVKKYSTGWVQTVGGTTVADGATLTVPHALGTADIIVTVYANATDSDSGSQQVVNQEWAGSSGFFYGAYVVSPASANVVVQLAAQGYTKGSTSGNSPTTTSWTGDYIKIVVMG
jgi:hypothetical protein